MASYNINKSFKSYQTPLSRTVAVSISLAVVAFVAANIGLVSPTVTGHTSKNFVAAAKSGGGGAVTIAPVVPVTWPSAVPIPTGTLIGANSSVPNSWTLQLRSNTSYSSTMQVINDLYLANGFSKPGQTAFYSNANYQVTVVGTNVDHDPFLTDVVIWLRAN